MDLIPQNSKVLVLCAHPDDEIACAGLLAKLLDSGHEIHCAFFSNCDDSTMALGFEPGRLLEECRNSCEVLSIAPANTYHFDIPTRHFPQYRQNILEELVKFRREIEPSLVLVACRADIHQDHSTLSQESMRAFKHTNVLGYEFPWNVTSGRLDMLVRLEERHVQKKAKAWSQYTTQKSRPYFGDDMVESLAKIRGVQANCRFAEGYEVLRLVL